MAVDSILLNPTISTLALRKENTVSTDAQVVTFRESHPSSYRIIPSVHLYSPNANFLVEARWKNWASPSWDKGVSLHFLDEIS